ncbi:MAG TPA: hypothetical protein VNG04_09355 [Candidatus Acidoferrum sp.]|nr:hypothetical protein [Candidatus Acidoferrum sp.]
MAANGRVIDVYCVGCGEEGEADAQTGRCLKCGKQAVQTTTQAQVDRNNHLTHSSPSAAYRVAATPFDASRSVAAVRQAHLTGPAQQVVLEHALDRHRHEAADSAPLAPDLTRFRLPSSRPTHRWLETTRALLEGFTASAAEAETKAAALEAKIHDQVAELKAEAMRLRNSARVIGQLLEQIGVEAPVLQTPPPKRAKSGPKPAGAWSLHHPRCIDCGTTDKPHVANGRCRVCDGRWRARPKVEV